MPRSARPCSHACMLTSCCPTVCLLMCLLITQCAAQLMLAGWPCCHGQVGALRAPPAPDTEPGRSLLESKYPQTVQAAATPPAAAAPALLTHLCHMWHALARAHTEPVHVGEQVLVPVLVLVWYALVHAPYTTSSKYHPDKGMPYPRPTTSINSSTRTAHTNGR